MATRLLFLFPLALFGLFLAWGAANQSLGLDFYQFWIVAQTLDRPGVNVYSEENGRSLGEEFLEKSRETGSAPLLRIAECHKIVETYASPFFYSLFRKFSTAKYYVDLCHYRLLMLACFVISIVILARLLDHPWDTCLGAVALFSAWFAPFSSDLRVANVNSLQLAAVAAYLWVTMRMRWAYRDILGGAILGLATAFKPNLVFIPAMIVIAWILHGQIRRLSLHAIGIFIGAAAAVVQAALSFGSFRCWFDWIALMRTLLFANIPLGSGNFAPVKIFDDWLGISTAIPIAIILLGLSILPLWLGRRNTAATNSMATVDLGAVLLGCCLIVLLPRLAWLHYCVLMLPVILFVTSPVYHATFGRRFLLLRHALIVLAILGYAFDAFRFIAFIPPPVFQSILTALSNLILFGVMLFDFIQSQRARA